MARTRTSAQPATAPPGPPIVFADSVVTVEGQPIRLSAVPAGRLSDALAKVGDQAPVLAAAVERFTALVGERVKAAMQAVGRPSKVSIEISFSIEGTANLMVLKGKSEGAVKLAMEWTRADAGG